MDNARANVEKFFRQFKVKFFGEKVTITEYLRQNGVAVKFRNFNASSYCTPKNDKFTLTEKFFRQINYLIFSLVKPLLSRFFCQKSVRVNFRTYSVSTLVIPTIFLKLGFNLVLSLNSTAEFGTLI